MNRNSINKFVIDRDNRYSESERERENSENILNYVSGKKKSKNVEIYTCHWLKNHNQITSLTVNNK